MLEVLQELGLDKYICKGCKCNQSGKKGQPTAEEIKLGIGDAEMTLTSSPVMVKESEGRLGSWEQSHGSTAENFDMVEHISNLRKYSKKLHLL